MPNQKLENLLNVSLNATPAELEQSPLLSSGLSTENEFPNPAASLWDIILRYSGSLSEILSTLPGPVRAVPLLGGYAILTLPKAYISLLSVHPLVQFIEQPKQIYYQFTQSQSVSCIPPVTRPPYSLSGDQILVGVVDSGIDLSHPAFLTPDGQTRVLRLWDQTGSNTLPPPVGYLMGSEYTKEEIQQRLDHKLPLPQDISRHGTAVCGIAAGSALSDGSGFVGVAPKASLAVVKLAPSAPNSFPRTSELMQGINYLAETAIALQMPMVINISIGNTYGSHDGTSLLESFLDTISNLWKITICIGTGNEGNDSGHTMASLSSFSAADIDFTVSPYETSLTIQIWKSYYDTLTLRLQSPAGTNISIPAAPGPYRFPMEQTSLLVYYGEPGPYAISQEIFLQFLPENQYLNSGVWKLILEGGQITDGTVNLWMNDGSQRNFSTRFLNPIPDTTLTIPSTAAKIIAVGAYDGRQKTYADFSGRGYTRRPVRIKPDLAAPGVEILAPRVGGGVERFTGTSFACPLVTGSAALLMEWGIIRGNDPFLFGEKVRAYLQKGARPLSAEREYPNPRLGYGTLCLLNSFPDSL